MYPFWRELVQNIPRDRRFVKMKLLENISYVMFMCVMFCYCNVKNDTNKSDEFIPTHEWQVVKKGQPVPKGLHIRINFETGVTEAKLMDANENDVKSLTIVNDENESKDNITANNNTLNIDKQSADSLRMTKAEIEEALKNIPLDVLNPTDPKRFRTLEELKSDFKEMKMDIKTDSEIMQDLFRRYELLKKYFPHSDKKIDNLEREIVDSRASIEILNILTDLEYLVHQFDNANEFVRLKGFEQIVYPHLNATDATLKAEAIKLLGSSLQNNIKVQIYALETGAGENLLKILALEKNEHVKAKAVFAIGCLVRRFPLAQKQVISKHGMDVFHKILSSDNPTYVKLKIKILTLLEDLVLEHKSVLENHVVGHPGDEEKLKQYYQVDLISKLSNPASCEILSKLLQEYFEYDSMNVDNIDKIFSVINTFSHICKHHHYKDKSLLVVFHKMQTLYEKIVTKKTDAKSTEGSDDDDTEFFRNILVMIDNYIDVLNDAKLKDEL